MFCGDDLAVISGYDNPRSVLQKNRLRGIECVKRKVPWVNSEKRGIVEMYCFTAENARKFVHKKPKQTEAVLWFLNTFIPEAEEIGRRKAKEKAREQEVRTEEAEPQPRIESRPEGVEDVRPPASSTSSIVERLDAIILECALLKQELRKTSW